MKKKSLGIFLKEIFLSANPQAIGNSNALIGCHYYFIILKTNA